MGKRKASSDIVVSGILKIVGRLDSSDLGPLVHSCIMSVISDNDSYIDCLRSSGRLQSFYGTSFFRKEDPCRRLFFIFGCIVLESMPLLDVEATAVYRIKKSQSSGNTVFRSSYISFMRLDKRSDELIDTILKSLHESGFRSVACLNDQCEKKPDEEQDKSDSESLWKVVDYNSDDGTIGSGKGIDQLWKGEGSESDDSTILVIKETSEMIKRAEGTPQEALTTPSREMGECDEVLFPIPSE